MHELRKAIELGYYVICQFESPQYDTRTGEGGLFANYVNTFLRLKQQASGWPDWYVDEPSKQRYIAEYERDEGVRLDADKIEKSPGLRSLAKYCLNSL